MDDRALLLGQSGKRGAELLPCIFRVGIGSGSKPVTLGLLVLVLSLLLTANKFSERSEKMPRCALEINNLCHKILSKCKDDNDSALYNKALTVYGTILDANDNHEQIDFAYVKLSLPEDYQFTKTQRFCVHVRYWLGYWVYGLLALLLLTAFIATFARKPVDLPSSFTKAS
ncbi:MAG: SLATT domain-containing protein [Prosthecobacter sp.]